MLDLDIFSIALIVIFIAASITGLIRWRGIREKEKKTGKKCNRVSLIVPILLILSVVLSLGLKTTMDVQSLNFITKRNIEDARNEKWELIERALKSNLDISYESSEVMATNIIKNLSYLTPEQTDYYLDNIGIIKNNPIQMEVDKELKGKYFDNIISDANDPFAMIIGKGPNDSFIFTDFSENCAIDKLTRNINTEISIHANKELAKVALMSLVELKTGKPLNETIFWQFPPKDNGAALSSLDYKGLKKSFFENDCDIEKTFKSIEFLSPFYIYRDKSLGGTPRIIDRSKTGAKVIAIVSVFSLYEVLNNDPYTLYIIEHRSETIHSLQEGMIQSERFLLLTSIFVMVISIIMFVLFWMYLHYNGGTKDERGDRLN